MFPHVVFLLEFKQSMETRSAL